jgi:putative lumazine-binding protein
MSTTETATTERQAIADVVQLYVDGASKGEADKLNEAFHESAWMFGSISGQRFDMPITQMIEICTSQPLDSDGSYVATEPAIEQFDDVATARLEEEGCWGNISFTDLFTLAKIDGSWKIVNKTFAHTGGEMPAA